MWADWALVAVTAVLAMYTYKLFAATRDLVRDAKGSADSQARLMAEQQRVMQLQADAATHSAAILQTQAGAMQSIADAVARSAQAALEAVAVAKLQGEVATRHLIANNPPVLTLRDVDLEELETKDVIRYSIANVGTTTATIVELSADDFWTGINRPFPKRIDYVANGDIAAGTRLEPGGTIECTHRYRSDYSALQGIRERKDMPEASLFFTARIVFDDDNKTRHVAYPIQRYDPATDRYVPVRSSDFET